MRVGVIVPVRAPAPYLAEALASVLAQEPPPDAVVVVDDGSDPPLRLDEQVRVVRIESSAGPAAARAAALAELDTDLVALADADDVWEPGKLAAQLAALDAHPGAAMCFGRAVVVDDAGPGTGAGLVDADVVRRARAHDLQALARGRVRQRRYGDAREALREAAGLGRVGLRERLLRVLLGVPGLRGVLGRRGPYR